jgi:AcrR family transcriptional regulator
MTTTDTPAPRRPRSDALRNRERVLASARAVLAEHGPDASLEEIARGAGVGIGTLYRHFPTRAALLDAVFRDSVDELCVQGRGLLDAPCPADAFTMWLQAQLHHATTYRSLAAAVMITQLDDPHAGPSPCQQLRVAGAELLDRAQASGAIRSDVDIDDVLRLVNGVAIVSEEAGDDGARLERADHLFALVLDGLRTGPGTRPRPA